MGTHSGRSTHAPRAALLRVVLSRICRDTPCPGHVEANAEFQLTSEGVRQRLTSLDRGGSISAAGGDAACAGANSSSPYLWLAHPTEGLRHRDTPMLIELIDCRHFPWQLAHICRFDLTCDV
jgi:hypothetical protein